MGDVHYWTVTLSNWQKQPSEVFYKKKLSIKIFVIFTGKHMYWSLFWEEVEIKLQAIRFSCENCKISNNTCFEEHLHMAASENDNKRFLGKATGHNDHYMINMCSQRPKIDGNWQLTSPYLQCWIWHIMDIIVIFHFGLFFALLPPLQPKKPN